MKKNISKILAIVVIAVLLMNTNLVLATNESDITSLKSQKEQNNQQKAQTQEELKEVQSKKSEAVKQVEKISSQIRSYQSQIDELEEKIDGLNTKISDAEKKIKEKETEYNKNQGLFEERLVASYEAGETSYLDVILSSQGLTDLISNYYLVSELANYDTELLESIQKQKEEIENTKTELESDKKEVTESKNSKETVANQLKKAKSEKASYVSELTEDEKELQTKIDEIEQANRQIDIDIESAPTKAIIEAAQNQSGNSGSSSSSGGSSSAGFIRPVNGTVTTGLYYSSGRYHGGVDFGNSGINGSPVYAVASGVVITTRALTTSYGNYVIIYHPGSNLYTLYAHGQAGSICVSEGQSVKQGQQIMRVGSTGNSSGPHLHFEVRVSPGKYDNRVNPLGYLP